MPNMKSNISLLVKSTSAGLQGRKLLQAGVDQLMGVSAEIATLLHDELQIDSIYDLAVAHCFTKALNMLDPRGMIPQEYAEHGFVPPDLVRVDRDEIADLAERGLEQLGFSKETTAAKIKNVLDIETIREMALWPAFLTARCLFDETFSLGRSQQPHRAAFDPESPEDLQVHVGDAAAEKAFMSATYLLDADLSDALGLAPSSEVQPEEASAEQTSDAPSTATRGLIDLTEKGQVDLLEGGLFDEVFDHAALGVRVTSEQTWISQGVTLGQLLHSVALAPGEVTRLAYVDWSRRSKGGRQEDVVQQEDLSWDSTLSRSIAEVTNAVAQETQNGYTQTDTVSHASQSANSGNFIAKLFGFGGSSSRSHRDSVTTNVSRSDGTRHLSTGMNRQINGRTHQHANADRKRRAAVVEETSQAEGEKLTTRVVANYNHMHALTVQYYEVVQNYRVETRATDYTRCVFVPLKLFDFRDPRVILKYRRILEYAALTDEVKQELASATEENWRKGHVVSLVDQSGQQLYRINVTDPTLLKIDYELSGEGIVDGIQLIFNDGTNWNSGPGGLAGDSEGSKAGSVFQGTQVAMSTISKVLYDPDNTNRGEALKLTYHFKGQDVNEETYEQTIQLKGDSYGYEALQVRVSKHDATAVIQHMQENAMYYSRAIWLNMDETDWMKALFTLTYSGKPVASTISPRPIALVGNYVAFAWHFEDELQKLNWLLETKLLDRDFNTWMQRKGYKDATDAIKEEFLDSHDEPQGDVGCQVTSVPMATGGVFAEAVLGRFNCAEKLDLTRFWNWQDSPIQIMPPEIQKLTPGSRDPAQWLSALKASGLDKQAIHLYMPSAQDEIDAAASTVDNTMGSLMQRLTMANVFRDMSNAASITTLAGQSVDTSAQGAKDAGEQETRNIQAVADVAAAAGKAAMTAAFPESSAASLVGGASSAGGLLNMAEQLDGAVSGGGGESTGGAEENAGGTPQPPTGQGQATAPAEGNQMAALRGLLSRFL